MEDNPSYEIVRLDTVARTFGIDNVKFLRQRATELDRYISDVDGKFIILDDLMRDAIANINHPKENAGTQLKEFEPLNMDMVMSHFESRCQTLVVVPEGTANIHDFVMNVLAPYNLRLNVQTHATYCGCVENAACYLGMTLASDEFGGLDKGGELLVPVLQFYMERSKDVNLADEDCMVCKGTGLITTEENPIGKWGTCITFELKPTDTVEWWTEKIAGVMFAHLPDALITKDGVWHARKLLQWQSGPVYPKTDSQWRYLLRSHLANTDEGDFICRVALLW